MWMILGFAWSCFLNRIAAGHGHAIGADDWIEDGFGSLGVGVNVISEQFAVHFNGDREIALFQSYYLCVVLR